MKKHKVGDRKWYVPGYRGHQLIAILCTINEIDEISSDYPLYWLDEPIGHSVAGDELLFQDEAVETILARYGDEIADEPELASELGSATLAEFRQESQSFIAGTWEQNGDKHPGFQPLPDKEPWQEWFNPQMIFDKRKGAIKGAAIHLDGIGTIWVEAPGRHNHVIAKVIEEHPNIPTPIGGEQGFVTQDGRFVDREEAANIALDSGQIERLNWPPELYSEDLW